MHVSFNVERYIRFTCRGRPVSAKQSAGTHFRRNLFSQTSVVIVLLIVLVLEGEAKEIKVEALTLTGKSLPVLVEQDATVRDLKREIYVSGGIRGPVRVLKGQSVLQDGSTLEENAITDDSTVNILIEPDQCINIDVKCGPKVYRKEISNSMTVGTLKVDLVMSNQVALQLDQFELAKILPKDGSVNSGTNVAELVDWSVPLHHCGIQADTNLTVTTSFIMINILNVNGEYLYRRVPKHLTINELKSDILSAKRYTTKFDYHDVIMFIKRGKSTYVELDPEAKYSVSEVLADDATLYLIADTFFMFHYPLYYNGSKIGKIGTAYEESVLNARLWTQVQTGIPVSDIRVLKYPPTRKGSKIQHQSSAPFGENNAAVGSTWDIHALEDNVKLSGYTKHYIEIV